MKNILNAHTKNIDSVLNDAQTSFSGLSQKEAEKRLLENGKNKLMEGKKQNPFVKFLLGFCDIMIIILMIAGIVSFCVGEILDGCVIFFIVILNAVLGFVQEYKAEKALDALKKMTKPFVKVLRGDEIKKIKSEDLVVGDILVLEAGDIAMADARLIESASLKCDESSLTGESEASFKNCDAILEEKTALGDMANFVFSGSVVVYGRGLAVVVATGADTQIGKISVMLHEKKKELTPLQKSLKTVGKFITVAVLIVAAITFVLEITKGGSPDYLNAFLTSVAIAVAAIPESLPAVITIIMAMGVSRLAGKKAIVKRLHAVETLGGCEIICSDKTGTLTQNVMTVKALVYNNTMTKDIDCNKNCDEFRVLSQILALCNDSKKDVDKFVGDPTETALTNFALGYGFDKSEMDKEWIRTFEIPFDSTRKMMSTITKNSGQLFLATKGGVDEVLAKCSSILENGKVRPICEKDKSDILSKNKEMTEKALRVLCGAYKLPISEKEFTEDNLIFVGLAGMIDPPRPDVEEAVKKCQRAGMKAIMITGDHPKTALAIAKAVGIASKESEVMTGLEIDGLSDKKFVEKLSTIRVFARVSPENKVRIVEGFKSLGKIVAMTGDGVNDAPSLKKASIGVGMGITGTDVTKEAADIIVTDDSFATIVIAVEEGRKIFKNIQKTINFLFASNFAEVMSLLLALIIFPELTFLLPLQILFVNLITDSLPAMALGHETAEKNIMAKPPRKSTDNLFSKGVGLSIFLQGFFQTLIVVSVFAIGNHFAGNAAASTMAFFTLNLIQVFFIFSVRTNNSIFKSNLFSNKWLAISILAINIILGLFAFTGLGALIGLVSLNYKMWLTVLGCSFLILPINEIYKAVYKKIKTNKANKNKIK